MARENKRKRDEKRFGKPERLIDIIAHERITTVAPEYRHDNFEALMVLMHEQMRGAVAVDCSNVYEYAIDTFNGKVFSFRDDVPNCMPQFPSMFLEYVETGGTRVGWFIHAFEDSTCGKNHAFTVVGHMFLAMIGSDGSMDAHLLGCIGIAINENGIAIGNAGVMPSFNKKMSNKDYEDAKSLLLTSSVFPFLAISFMHCKNVSITAVQPEKAIEKQRLKAGLKPFLRYHTININPMKQILKTEGDAEQSGLKKALHICRGHFSSYTEDKPLFGRKGMHGQFWTPAHVRGSIAKGIVNSDYKVGIPTPGGPT